jgi:hypothetical protein
MDKIYTKMERGEGCTIYILSLFQYHSGIATTEISLNTGNTKSADELVDFRIVVS